MDKSLPCNNDHACKNNHNLRRDNIYTTVNETNCEFFKGRTLEMELKQNYNDVRLDLVLDKKNICKLWGHVKDDSGNLVENALVTLLKPKYIRGNIEYFPIATTLSDCVGFYQFEIDTLEKGLTYRVSVSKF